MSVAVGRAKLNNATKDLLVKWEQTRSVWLDSRAQAFEREFIEPLGPQVRSALSAMERLSGILTQAERECGP